MRTAAFAARCLPNPPLRSHPVYLGYGYDGELCDMSMDLLKQPREESTEVVSHVQALPFRLDTWLHRLCSEEIASSLLVELWE